MIMKKLWPLFVVLFLISCTSNTIFKKPEDLIPKDTMALLIYDLYLVNAAKHVKNKRLEKKVNYMPFLFDKYHIDSLRFQTSNFYYTSKIDDYEELLQGVKKRLEALQKEFTAEKTKIDSIRRDSLSRAKKLKQETTKLPEKTTLPKKNTLSDKVVTKE